MLSFAPRRWGETAVLFPCWRNRNPINPIASCDFKKIAAFKFICLVHIRVLASAQLDCKDPLR